MSNTTPNPATEDMDLQLKSDIVLLVDLVTEHSREVRLVSHDDLFLEFAEKAACAAPLSVAEVRDDIDRSAPSLLKKQEEGEADDSPRAKERRRLLSRRAMLSSLFNGELSVHDLKEEKEPEPQPEPEKREITPEYFEKVLEAALAGNCSIDKLDSWDNVKYYHFTPLLSCTYARLLSAQNNAFVQIVETIRENSRIYPRPLGVYTFEFYPFNIPPETIQEVLNQIAANPETQDIRVSETSSGAIYLYSNRYLEDAYADFLAEEMDRGTGESL